MKATIDIDVFFINANRALISVMFSGPVAVMGVVGHRRRQKRRPLFTSTQKWQLLLRVVAMNTGICCTYYAIRNMPLGKKEN